uniref:ATP synthase F0 subunit 8 n=1 Tax=Runaria sp. 'striata' TaxID=2950365 RepID=A0A977TLB3_9HYME|nr:ATP synthase F0 subunit 8 [Runaria sp. 'striata']
MPQMAPIMWAPLFIYFNLILLFFLIMFYYFFTPIKALYTPLFSLKKSKNNSSWTW